MADAAGVTVSEQTAIDEKRRGFRRSLLLWMGLFATYFVVVVGPQPLFMLTNRINLENQLVRLAMTLLIGGALGWIVFRIHDLPRRRWWPAVLAAVQGAVVAMIAVDAVVDWYRNTLGTEPIGPVINTLEWEVMYLWIFGTCVLFVHIGQAEVRARLQAAELSSARMAATQAQLAMLRYQLNPHFLFNTLNAISTLIVTRRPEQADEMLTKLSEFLRESLATQPNEFCTLHAELGLLEDYLAIEAVRFGDRLQVEFACDPRAADMLIPSLILQPLVENAVKYAVGPSAAPVTIRIDARLDGDDLVMLVIDQGTAERTSAQAGTGVGLRNVRTRLATIYGNRASLEALPTETGFLAVVRLPASRQHAAIHLAGEQKA